MPRIPGIRHVLSLRGRRTHVEVDDEFAFHLEMRTRELIDRGYEPAAARQEAMRLFGDMDDARSYCSELGQRRKRHTMRMELLDRMWRDVVFSVRSLRRTPGFTLVAVITLALGVGANVTMLGIVDRLLLRPPAHVREPGLVRRLYFTTTRDGETTTEPHMSFPRYLALQERMRPVASVAAFYDAQLIVGEREGAHPGRVTLVTANYFPLLGVRPELGRFFTADEEVPPNGARVAVISHRLWKRDFGGSVSVLGSRLAIAGQQFQVVGVAPADFAGPGLERIDAWVPMSALAGDVVGQYAKEPWYQAHNIGWLRGIARLNSDAAAARGASLATAGLRQSLEARWNAARADSMKPRATLEPLLLERGPDRTPSARIAVWLAGMSLLVLLIAAANVANLLLARALRRRRETAVRVALGAGRSRLVAQTLTEGMLIALVGGAAAMFVAHVMGKVVRHLLVRNAEWSTLLDVRSLVLAGAMVVITGLLTGLLPVLQLNDVDLVSSLKAGARDGGGRRSVSRSALVVVQSALSLVLLVGAGLFLRSLHNAQSVDLGFTPERVLTVDLDLGGAGYSTAEELSLYEQLYQRLATLPGVRSASLGVTKPFSTTLDYNISIPGRDSVRLPASGAPRVNSVTPEFFTTMDTRLVAGRGITPADRKGAPMVTVINQTMARALWPNRTPIGERVCMEVSEKPCFEIVGIAQDARWSTLQGDPTMQMYFPLEQSPTTVPIRVLYLRTTGDPTRVIASVQREVRAIAPRVSYANVTLFTEALEPQLRPWRLGATVFTVFGVLAIVLAALGLYGVISYDVAQRTRELGVRIALGARSTSVVWLVVGQGMRVAGVGIAAGLVIALAAGRWIGPLLFDTAPRDPIVLGSVAFTLFGVAVLASLIPAWRATRVPPGTALRAE